MPFRRLQDLDVAGKRVIVREDLNVPIAEGTIGDYARIDAALPTLRWLEQRGAKTIVLSHLGRPDGKPDPALSLAPVARALSQALGTTVAFAGDCVGEVAQRAIAQLHDGEILLLENVRFHPEEERNDPGFARRL
ncbi:MAG TPA: phosphoglycerate kinase, partial [Candidatus Cybelea sp.]